MLKRLFDLLAAALGVVMLSPLLLLIAGLIGVSSPGPIFHRAERVGQHGRLFRLYKFRSMTAGADKVGPGITRRGDSRVTPLGRWLRRLKLDELPQLLNVLKGEMSLVGPRPEDPRYVAQYTPEQRRVLEVRPGITSPASIYYRHEEALLTGGDWEEQYTRVVMPDKLRIELDYLSCRSFGSDLGIIFQTLAAIWHKAQ